MMMTIMMMMIIIIIIIITIGLYPLFVAIITGDVLDRMMKETKMQPKIPTRMLRLYAYPTIINYYYLQMLLVYSIKNVKFQSILLKPTIALH